MTADTFAIFRDQVDTPAEEKAWNTTSTPVFDVRARKDELASRFDEVSMRFSQLILAMMSFWAKPYIVHLKQDWEDYKRQNWRWRRAGTEVMDMVLVVWK